MIIYIYSKCSTCQNAVRFLEKHQIKFTTQEISLNPPSFDELHKMLNFQNGHLKKLLNTSGLLYREMKLSEKLKEIPDSQVLALLTLNGMLIKRPFLLSENFGLLGFKENEWQAKFK